MASACFGWGGSNVGAMPTVVSLVASTRRNWRCYGKHQATKRCAKEHQESRGRREEETNDCASAEVGKDGAGQAGRQSGSQEAEALLITLAALVIALLPTSLCVDSTL